MLRVTALSIGFRGIIITYHAIPGDTQPRCELQGRCGCVHHSGMMAAVRYAASPSPRRHRPPASAATENPSDTGNIIRLPPSFRVVHTTSTGPAAPGSARVGELLSHSAPITTSDNGHNVCRFQANTSSPSMTLIQTSSGSCLWISDGTYLRVRQQRAPIEPSYQGCSTAPKPEATKCHIRALLSHPPARAWAWIEYSPVHA